MSYLKSLRINTDRTNPYPFDVPAIKFSKNIEFDKVTFIIGDNGTGKSTLLESLAFRLHLPHIDGSRYNKKAFETAKSILPFMELEWNIDRSVGFFFRAEDFGDFMNSVDRTEATQQRYFSDLEGDVPEHVIRQMKESANYQLHHVRKNYGQELNSFSHGEAYLQIMNQKINQRGIFILDEPEAALSPAKQIALIHFIHQHLQAHVSQFIIATHSPMLMAMPGAKIYEVTQHGMASVALEETEHYSLTKSFLNNPSAFLRHL